MLCQLCDDSSVATRKAAADALTQLVRSSSEECTTQSFSLETAWAHAVLPLVFDTEASCVTKAVELFTVLVVEPIVELGQDSAMDVTYDYGDGRNKTSYLVAWRILSKLRDGSEKAGGLSNTSGSLMTALQKLLIQAGKDASSLVKHLLQAVYHVGGTSLGLDQNSSSSHDNSIMSDDDDVAVMRTGAWCLLAALCNHPSNESSMSTTKNSSFAKMARVSLDQAVQQCNFSSFLALSLKKLRALIKSPDVPPDKKESLLATLRDCLKVIANMSHFISYVDAKACFADLHSDLQSFTLSIGLISTAVHASVALTNRMCGDDEASGSNDVHSEVLSWVNGMLHSCEVAMESCYASLAQRGTISKEDETLLSHILYLIGELSIIGFTPQEEEDSLSSSTTKQEDNMTLLTGRESVRGLLICPPSRLLYLVKLLLPNTIPRPGAESECDELTTPSTLRAHAFITLGKFCLRDESLAKESLNMFARELHHRSNSDPAVQSNCLIVMGDLCLRYTNLGKRADCSGLNDLQSINQLSTSLAFLQLCAHKTYKQWTGIFRHWQLVCRRAMTSLTQAVAASVYLSTRILTITRL